MAQGSDELRRLARRVEKRLRAVEDDVAELSQALSRVLGHDDEVCDAFARAIARTDAFDEAVGMAVTEVVGSIVAALRKEVENGGGVSEHTADLVLQRVAARARLKKPNLSAKGRSRVLATAVRIGAITKEEEEDYRAKHGLLGVDVRVQPARRAS